jgi:hypothetical protein
MFDDARWGDGPRDRDSGSRDLGRGSRGGSDPRERQRVEPRDIFVDRVSLPRGPEREPVRPRPRLHSGGSESRTLASVGTFRVVPAHDLRNNFDKPLDPRHGELWHLHDLGFVETVRLDRDTMAVTLTKAGCDLLESRRRDQDSRAKAGGPDAAAVVRYLEEVGDADRRPPTAPLDAADRDAIVGRYAFGTGPRDYFDIDVTNHRPGIARPGMSRRGLAHGRAGVLPGRRPLGQDCVRACGRQSDADDAR